MASRSSAWNLGGWVGGRLDGCPILLIDPTRGAPDPLPTPRPRGWRGVDPSTSHERPLAHLGDHPPWFRERMEVDGFFRTFIDGGPRVSSMEIGVQRQYAPNSICFGCGPANSKGLRIDSKRSEGGLSLTFMPEAHHEAFPGMINGGVIGTLLDCHGNWTAAIALMDAAGAAEPPCTVTASYSVSLRRPTPSGVLLEVYSEVLELNDDRVRVALTMEADGKVRATGEGLFVAVTEGHPAYHRWS